MNDLIPAAIHHTGHAMLPPKAMARATCFREDGCTVLTIESEPWAPVVTIHLTAAGLAALAALLTEAIEAHNKAGADTCAHVPAPVLRSAQ